MFSGNVRGISENYGVFSGNVRGISEVLRDKEMFEIGGSRDREGSL